MNFQLNYDQIYARINGEIDLNVIGNGKPFFLNIFCLNNSLNIGCVIQICEREKNKKKHQLFVTQTGNLFEILWQQSS